MTVVGCFFPIYSESIIHCQEKITRRVNLQQSTFYLRYEPEKSIFGNIYF